MAEGTLQNPRVSRERWSTGSAPYGANAATWTWASRHKLRFTEHARCLHWAATGRCVRTGRRDPEAICLDGNSSRQWMDHVSGWLGPNGERLLLCQPYWLTDIVSLVAACEQFNLKAEVHGNGWYGHGTVAIELTPQLLARGPRPKLYQAVEDDGLEEGTEP